MAAVPSSTTTRTAHGAVPHVEVRTPRRPLHPLLPSDKPIIVTIDGPAGTGKSSVARLLARRLGLDFLDTGAMYRAAAVVAIERGLGVDRAAELVAAVVDADLHFDWSADPPDILASGRSVSSRIRGGDVTAVVSPIAGIPALRRHMVRKQRLIAAQHPRLVTEGRDQGSVVFPAAPVKFYLDAAPATRARRRADQLREAGLDADADALLADITERDRSDSTRREGPLIKPGDAIVVDTTSLSLEGVVGTLERLVLERMARA
ncbi:MAG: (d)CMP kinase [Phycisphaerae bacterium]|nr:(d)CMP kinase [Phycisphaerae bacterium]